MNGARKTGSGQISAPNAAKGTIKGRCMKVGSWQMPFLRAYLLGAILTGNCSKSSKWLSSVLHLCKDRGNFTFSSCCCQNKHTTFGQQTKFGQIGSFPKDTQRYRGRTQCTFCCLDRSRCKFQPEEPALMAFCVTELPVSMSCLMSINGRTWLIIKITCSEVLFGYLGTGNMTFHCYWKLD